MSRGPVQRNDKLANLVKPRNCRSASSSGLAQFVTSHQLPVPVAPCKFNFSVCGSLPAFFEQFCPFLIFRGRNWHFPCFNIRNASLHRVCLTCYVYRIDQVCRKVRLSCQHIYVLIKQMTGFLPCQQLWS
jgi:hypothetical protein